MNPKDTIEALREASETIKQMRVDNAYLQSAVEVLKEELAAVKNAEPCLLCRYNPPSSGDGKPCTMCPARK